MTQSGKSKLCKQGVRRKRLLFGKEGSAAAYANPILNCQYALCHLAGYYSIRAVHYNRVSLKKIHTVFVKQKGAASKRSSAETLYNNPKNPPYPDRFPNPLYKAFRLYASYPPLKFQNQTLPNFLLYGFP